VLTGLSRLDSGRALIDGIDIVRDPLAAKRRCGLVTQHVNLDGELSCRENLDIHGRLYGLGRSERRARTAETLALVEMDGRAGDLVKTLSGGYKRRLMIARSLVHSPALLFLDEPTAGLDPAIRRRVWSLVKGIAQAGVTVFLTTHYIEEAEFLADRVAFIDAGVLVETDTPGAFMDRLGRWAVDIHDGGAARTVFFEDRERAGELLRDLPGGAVVRRVNLEDAFLAKTGRRVDP
jgi:ABC-2 type transport system ATP-binding protein